MSTTTTCPYCGAEVDRVLEPPIVRVPRAQLPTYDDGDDRVLWHAPGQAFPGGDWYDVLRADDAAVYARPWECSNDPLCVRCWAGSVIPAIEHYLDNKPAQLRLNGWRAPEWIEVTR